MTEKKIEIDLDTQETQDISRAVSPWPERATALVVQDEPGYLKGATLLQEIKALRGQVDAAFDPIIKAANRAHRQALESKKGVEAPLVQAERTIKGAMGDYAEEQRRKQREAARAAAEAARKAQEEARRAERLKTQKAQEKAAQRVEAAVEAAHEAQAIADQAAPPVAKGVSTSLRWSAKVDDLLALVGFVAQNPHFIGLVQANETALNALARAQKADLSIPGVRAVGQNTVTVR